MREYEIEVRGQTFRVLATEADAKRRGLKPVDVAPAAKTPVEPEKKARAVPNKARAVPNK